VPEQNILLQTLDTRWQRLRKEWERTRRTNSDDAVHDLRVASRRLIAVLDVLRSLVDDSQIEECRRRLKKSLGALGPLRDVQVQRSSVSKMAESYPQLKTFQKCLKKKEDKIARKARKPLKDGPKLDEAITQARNTAWRLADNQAILRIVHNRYDEVLDLAKQIDPADASTIHRTRLAFKRFRYTAEVVQPLVTELTESRLEELHDFQGMMGDIQDFEVLSARLLKWAQKKEGRMAESSPVLDDLKRQEQTAIQTFMASLPRIYTFEVRAAES